MHEFSIIMHQDFAIYDMIYFMYMFPLKEFWQSREIKIKTKFTCMGAARTCQIFFFNKPTFY